MLNRRRMLWRLMSLVAAIPLAVAACVSDDQNTDSGGQGAVAGEATGDEITEVRLLEYCYGHSSDAALAGSDSV